MKIESLQDVVRWRRSLEKEIGLSADAWSIQEITESLDFCLELLRKAQPCVHLCVTYSGHKDQGCTELLAQLDALKKEK